MQDDELKICEEEEAEEIEDDAEDPVEEVVDAATEVVVAFNWRLIGLSARKSMD